MIQLPNKLIVYFIANTVSKFITGLSMIFLARLVSKSDFGVFRTSTTLVLFLYMVTNFGLVDNALYQYSKTKEKNVFQKTLSHYNTNYFIFLLILLLAYFLMDDRLWGITILLFLKAYLEWFLELNFSKLQAEDSYIDVSMITFMIASVPAVSSFLVYLSSISIVTYTLLLFLGTLFVTIYVVVKYKLLKISDFQISFSFDYIKNTFSFFVSNFMTFIYMQSNVILISFIKGYEEVAKFTAVSTIIMAYFLFPTIIYNYFLPKMISNSDNLMNFKTIAKNYFKINIIINASIFIFTFIFSENLILLFYKDKYLDSLIVFRILLIFYMLHCIIYYFGAVFTSMGKQSLRSKLQTYSAVFNILVNLLLIPSYASEGASIAMLLTDMVIFVLYYLNYRKVILKEE